jgi:hypothetical protein
MFRIFTAPPLVEPVGPVAKHQAEHTVQTTTHSLTYTNNNHSYFYSFAFFNVDA